jgi:hypothetical protein
LGRTKRRFQDLYSHGLHTEIQFLGVDAVSIVNQKSVALLVANGRTKLLQSPGCVGMGSYIEVDKSSRAYFHDDKHIENLKTGRYRYKEIASQHGLRVIADEGHPSLGSIRALAAAIWILPQIFLDGSRGNLNPELYEEFVGYASLSPGGIFPRNDQNEPTKIFGNPRSADAPGFPSPEQPKTSSVPSGEGLRSNRH